MKKTISIPFASVLILALSCNSNSDSFGSNYVTFKTLQGWCLPACVIEFTVTPNKTFYKESNYEGNDGRFFSQKTKRSDWEIIEFFLESTGYRNIHTDPTCARCYDGNDYILEIKDGRFSNTIYYTRTDMVESIHDFDFTLQQMKNEFLNKFNQPTPE
tara:strand:+ start:70234 stop:70707 length:474 start_codon:yes stop_codon:yes gene_type:complete